MLTLFSKTIQDTNSKFRKYKSRHERSLDAAASSNMSSNGSIASRSLAHSHAHSVSVAGNSRSTGAPPISTAATAASLAR